MLLSERYQTIVSAGTSINYNFEGKHCIGKVIDESYDRRVVCVKRDSDGVIFWTHVSHVSLRMA
jgi:hypothetical protein